MTTKARLAVVTMLLGGSLMAQEGQMVSSAILATRSNDFAQAKVHIDEAGTIIAGKSEDEIRESTMQKYWYNRGLIYQTLAGSSDNAVEMYSTAIESFANLIAYDIKVDDDDYQEESEQRMSMAFSEVNKLADGAYFDAHDVPAAYGLYTTVYDLKQEYLHQMDTATIYTLARLAAEMGDDNAALNHYTKLTEVGYKGQYWTAYYDADGSGTIDAPEMEKRLNMPDKVTLDLLIAQKRASNPEKSEDINYMFWAQACNYTYKLGDTAKTLELVAQALEVHPGNATLANLQLQYLLDAGDYETALANFEKALETEPNNVTYLYNVGYIYQTKVNNGEKALEFYNRALAADSSDINSAYMAGLVYVEKANGLTDEINNLPRNATTKYNQLTEERKGYYETARDYFLIAHGIDGRELATVQALREVYFKLGDATKVGEMTRLKTELEAAQ